jgi:uncharacterized protein YndB with AHSA1/START domain
MTDLVAKAGMLIRRPPETVFNAFVDPAVTTKFWFTKSSGRLEAGRRVRWDWEMYGVGGDVEVKTIEPNRRIVFEWSFPDSTIVEWRFTPHAKGTFVAVTNRGFKGESAVAQALDATEGFNIVLCAAKAWLEHGVALNAVADKAPDHTVETATER